MMSPLDLSLYVLVTCFLSWGLGRAATAAPFHRLARPNYRGVNLNPVLGLTVALSSIWVVAWSLAARAIGGRWEPRFDVYLWFLGAGALVLAAGFIDDLSEAGPRGLRGHLESALRGRPSTGLLKLVAAVIGGGLIVTGLASRPLWVMAAGVIAMAGCANLWNDLDVAPGRAGKAFLYLACVLPFIGPTSVPQAVLFVLLFAELPALRVDLLERGMLGDAGANFLGLMIGASLYAVLPDWGVGVAVVVVVLLNLVAETMTLSRVIRAIAPLRWFDELGTSAEWRRFSENRES